MKKRAVVLLSGGLDSATCLGIAQADGFSLYPLTFLYGQRHAREVACAQRLAQHYGVEKQHLLLPLALWSKQRASSLTDAHLTIPTAHTEKGIPSTYVPGRNLVFFACGAAYAETIGASSVYVGISSVDYSGYPDCRPAFLQALQATVQEATRAGQEEGKEAPAFCAPLLHLSKAETIAWGLRLAVPYQWTTSCYQGEEVACGQCDSCSFRQAGFAACRQQDPIPYASAG